MANYEMMIIINPSLGEEDRNTSYEGLKKILKKYSAKIEKEDIWGDKKMAYKINRSKTGYYVLLDLDMDGVNIKTISKELNLDKNIWRYMFVKKNA